MRRSIRSCTYTLMFCGALAASTARAADDNGDAPLQHPSDSGHAPRVPPEPEAETLPPRRMVDGGAWTAPAPPAEPSWFYVPPLEFGLGSGRTRWSLQFYGFAELDIIRDSTRGFNESLGNAIIPRRELLAPTTLLPRRGRGRQPRAESRGRQRTSDGERAQQPLRLEGRRAARRRSEIEHLDRGRLLRKSAARRHVFVHAVGRPAHGEQSDRVRDAAHAARVLQARIALHQHARRSDLRRVRVSELLLPGDERAIPNAEPGVQPQSATALLREPQPRCVRPGHRGGGGATTAARRRDPLHRGGGHVSAQFLEGPAHAGKPGHRRRCDGHRRLGHAPPFESRLYSGGSRSIRPVERMGRFVRRVHSRHPREELLRSQQQAVADRVVHDRNRVSGSHGRHDHGAGCGPLPARAGHDRSLAAGPPAGRRRHGAASDELSGRPTSTRV